MVPLVPGERPERPVLLGKQVLLDLPARLAQRDPPELSGQLVLKVRKVPVEAPDHKVLSVLSVLSAQQVKQALWALRVKLVLPAPLDLLALAETREVRALLDLLVPPDPLVLKVLLDLLGRRERAHLMAPSSPIRI